MAREAAPSSATDAINIDVVQRMAQGPANLRQVTSVMGRGPIQGEDGESDDHRLVDTKSNDRGNREGD